MWTMAEITRSYRIRAYPNGAQRRLLDRWFGGIRWLWNTTLEIRSVAYRECGLTLTGNDLSRWLTQWKRTSGHEWLAELPATAFEQCLRDQDSAFRNFFAQRACYPRFKRKQHTGSLRFRGGACSEEILEQVLAEEARSGHRNRTCLGQAWSR
jgi:putative transposase